MAITESGSSDLRDGCGAVALADRAASGRDAVAGTGRGQREFRVQGYDLRALEGPETVARGAAVPLGVGRPFLVTCRHILVQASRQIGERNYTPKYAIRRRSLVKSGRKRLASDGYGAGDGMEYADCR